MMMLTFSFSFSCCYFIRFVVYSAPIVCCRNERSMSIVKIWLNFSRISFEFFPLSLGEGKLCQGRRSDFGLFTLNKTVPYTGAATDRWPRGPASPASNRTTYEIRAN